MSGHTPGPWIVHQRPNEPIEYGHHVTTADGLTVCSVTYQLPESVDGKVVEARRIANARLIAAAPDLLEALRWAMRQVGPRPHRIAGQNDRYCDEYARAEAAIAKATGGTP